MNVIDNQNTASLSPGVHLKVWRHGSEYRFQASKRLSCTPQFIQGRHFAHLQLSLALCRLHSDFSNKTGRNVAGKSSACTVSIKPRLMVPSIVSRQTSAVSGWPQVRMVLGTREYAPGRHGGSRKQTRAPQQHPEAGGRAIEQTQSQVPNRDEANVEGDEGILNVMVTAWGRN